MSQVQLFALAAAEERASRTADLGRTFRASRTEKALEAFLGRLGVE